MSEDATEDSPCQRCGACCASFRVAFYWAEGEALPPALVQPLRRLEACMAGTDTAAPHCAALEGEVGRSTRCAVYARRPSPCRSVQPGDAQCLRARDRHDLPALPRSAHAYEQPA